MDNSKIDETDTLTSSIFLKAFVHFDDNKLKLINDYLPSIVSFRLLSEQQNYLAKLKPNLEIPDDNQSDGINIYTKFFIEYRQTTLQQSIIQDVSLDDRNIRSNNCYSLGKFFQFNLPGIIPSLQQIDILDDRFVWFFTLDFQPEFLQNNLKHENEDYIIRLKKQIGMPSSFVSRDSCPRIKHLKSNAVSKVNKDTELNSLTSHPQSHRRRHFFFSKYDEGIKMDDNSWRDATPEKLAQYISYKMQQISKESHPIGVTHNQNEFSAETNYDNEICQCSVVIDLFCGVGGNLVNFCNNFDLVIGVDINQNRLSMCYDNAKIYGVQEKIVLIHGDSLDFLKKILQTQPPFEFHNSFKTFKTNYIDCIFLSPPWGLEYKENGPSMCFSDLKISEFENILLTCAQVAPVLCLYFPKTQNALEVIISSILMGFSHLEIEDIWIQKRHNTKVTLYFIKGLEDIYKENNDNHLLEGDKTIDLISILAAKKNMERHDILEQLQKALINPNYCQILKFLYKILGVKSNKYTKPTPYYDLDELLSMIT